MKYKVKQGCKLRRNDVRYNENESLEMNEVEAKPLVETGVLELLPQAEEQPLPLEIEVEVVEPEPEVEPPKPVKAVKRKPVKKTTKKKKEK